jgi:uncharacterized delta-60 repeat protein
MAFSLNAQDGALDTTFDPGVGPNNGVFCMALQADGKVLVGGGFDSYNGAPKGRIARLNTDGTLDESFPSGSGAQFVVYAIAVQPDGKILVGGQFETFNGEPHSMLVRLNSDGSVDNTFNIGAGPDWIVFSLNVQPDGKILVGGNFTLVDDVSRVGIARLNSDGSLDLSFNPGTGLGSTGIALTVDAMALQPDGKVIIGGSFNTYNGSSRNSIARLNSDGSLDTSFDPGNADPSGGVACLLLQPDGKVLVGGLFTGFANSTYSALVRLNSDGSIDNSFNTGEGPSSWVFAIVRRPDGRLIIAGQFFAYDDVARNRIAGLLANGALDTSFDPGTGATGLDATAWALALQPDGKAVVAGTFTLYDTVTRNRIARVLGDGTTDLPEHSSTSTALRAWPNPTNGILQLSQPVAGNVLDAQERVVMTFGRSADIDVTTLVPGVYMLRTEVGHAIPFMRE